MVRQRDQSLDGSLIIIVEGEDSLSLSDSDRVREWKEGDVSPPAVFVSGDEIFSSGGVGVGAVLVVVVVGKPVNR